MTMKKHQCAALAMLLCAGMLTGCSTSVSYQPDQSGVYVDKTGTVKSAEVESFDNSAFNEERYREDELLTFVQGNVIAYNKDTCGLEAAYMKDAEGLKVGIVDLQVKDAVATLILEYATCEDYLAFNEANDSVQRLELFAATEAEAGGVSLAGLVDKDGKQVDASAVNTKAKYNVLVVNGQTEVVVNGKIVGASSQGCEQKDTHTVEISGDQDVVIVFK